MARYNSKCIPQNILLRMRLEDKEKLGIASPATSPAKPTGAFDLEAPFQETAEDWLRWRGYWSRTETNIAAGPPPTGWMIHLHEAERNPLLLDLLLLANDGRWLEIELKSEKGRVKKHQEQLVEQSENCHLQRSMDEVKQVVSEWEESND